jgi:hypothetical protein
MCPEYANICHKTWKEGIARRFVLRGLQPQIRPTKDSNTEIKPLIYTEELFFL